MTKKVAVIVIHGIGSQDRYFADEMKDEINERISNLQKDPDKIAWRPIYWADILEPKQSEYFIKAKINHEMGLSGLRRFILSALGDAAAYQRVESDEKTSYEKFHERVRKEISQLYKVDLGSQECPVIILAHSLGGHIMSNYIWDMQKSPPDDLSSFEKLEHLAGMVTFGCNIPLFTFAHTDVTPIDFPGEKLSDDLRFKAKWLNYYDRHDILGYPLKAVNEKYNKIVEDIPITVGSIIIGLSPVSHNGYWTDNSFTKPVSRYIGEFL